MGRRSLACQLQLQAAWLLSRFPGSILAHQLKTPLPGERIKTASAAGVPGKTPSAFPALLEGLGVGECSALQVTAPEGGTGRDSGLSEGNGRYPGAQPGGHAGRRFPALERLIARTQVAAPQPKGDGDPEADTAVLRTANSKSAEETVRAIAPDPERQELRPEAVAGRKRCPRSEAPKPDRRRYQ